MAVPIAQVLALFSVLALLPATPPADRYAVVPFEQIVWVGEAPAPDDPSAVPDLWRSQSFLEGFVVLDGGGEAFLEYSPGAWPPHPRQPVRCALHATTEGEIAGRIFLAQRDYAGFEPHRFRVAAAAEDPEAKASYLTVRAGHYDGLADRGLPGAAWFRRMADEARADRSAETLGAAAIQRGPRNTGGFDTTFDLFTGNRAIAENLDLDAVLRGIVHEEASIDIDSIPGVTTRAMDWKALVQGLHPDLDPLARLVPADQHAVFFPSFEAMTRVFDEVDEAGTPVLQFASSRTEDQVTKERYQEQLCLPLSAVSRLLGPAIVASVAVTGGDPYLPSGSDLAILFDCKDAGTLEKVLALRHVEARSKGARPLEGLAGAVRWSAARSPDRRISSYVARIGETVVVSNSLVQIEHLAAVAEGRAPAIAQADEYVWFRDRYRRGDPEESAFLVLTDATIRRWASPRSRIGDSRRVRALAALTEIHLRNLDAVVRNEVREGEAVPAADLQFGDGVAWRSGRAHSDTFGSPAFLTPISELAIPRVTASEKLAYERFRASFQRRWSTVFDPIALRLSFTPTRAAADLTVMPLVVDSEYRELRDLTLDASLAPSAGDPHEGTLFHVAFAFGKRSDFARFAAQGIGSYALQLGADPLGWIGDGISFYAERDPFWDEAAQAPRGESFITKNFYRMPAALHVEVRDPLQLAAFLTGLRAMADGAAPGMTRWETKTWHEQGYVRIGIDEDVGLDENLAKAAIYYAAMPKAFVLSLREDVIQRAIDRRLERKARGADGSGGSHPSEGAGGVGGADERPWLGSSLGLRAEREAVELFGALADRRIASDVQRTAWTALPILGEWKRRFPAEDPVRVHESVYGVRLTTPAGGTFAWNDEFQSMETSDYGSPAAPREGPAFPAALQRLLRGSFGLGFEGEGLRVRAELERAGR